MYIKHLPATLLRGFFFQIFFLDFPLHNPVKYILFLYFIDFPIECSMVTANRFLQKAPGRGEREKEMGDAVLIIELAKSL